MLPDGNTIAGGIYYCSTRIEIIENDKIISTGTGFFFTYNHNNIEYKFIVSNRHVALNADCLETFDIGKIYLRKMDNQGAPLSEMQGIKISSKDWKRLWFPHPDENVDIAIFPMDNKAIPNLGPFYHSHVMQDEIPSIEQLKDIDAIDSITFVGYPSGIWDTENFSPIIRQGITATPIQIDYANEPKFLIDASVFPGSSGSPVFIYKEGLLPTKQGTLSQKRLIHFVGIVTETMLQAGVIPEISQNIDLGIVIKAEMVVETIKEYFNPSFQFFT